MWQAPGITVGANDVCWETMSIPRDRAHMPGAGIATSAPGPDRKTVPTPSDCERVPGTGTGSDDGGPFFVLFYVDDGILVEVSVVQDGRRLRRAMESLVLDYFRLLGPRGPRNPPYWKRIRSWGWSTPLEVLDWVLRTYNVTTPLPPRKSSKLRQFFAD